jgi:hypothetical protein
MTLQVDEVFAVLVSRFPIPTPCITLARGGEAPPKLRANAVPEGAPGLWTVIFGHHGDLHDRISSFIGLNAPGPRGSWTEGTPHFHLLVTRAPFRERGAGGQTLAYKQRLAPVGRSQVPQARSKGPRGACI